MPRMGCITTTEGRREALSSADGQSSQYGEAEMAELLDRDRSWTSTHSRCVRLLHPDRITTADCAATHYRSIHTNVDLVMLGRGAQDSRISREIPLRESGHHTTPARTGDVQAHRRP